MTYKQGAQISVEQQLSENSRGLARYLRITDFRSDDDIRYVADMHQDVYCTEDDLLMIRYGGTASEVVSGKAGIFHNNMFRIDFDARLLESSFLQKFLGIPDTRKNLLSGSTSSTMPQISHRIMNLLIIALPPIKEQKRISDKLEELQTIYDELNSSIQYVNSYTACLADSIVEHAVL